MYNVFNPTRHCIYAIFPISHGWSHGSEMLKRFVNDLSLIVLFYFVYLHVAAVHIMLLVRSVVALSPDTTARTDIEYIHPGASGDHVYDVTVRSSVVNIPELVAGKVNGVGPFACEPLVEPVSRRPLDRDRRPGHARRRGGDAHQL